MAKRKARLPAEAQPGQAGDASTEAVQSAPQMKAGANAVASRQRLQQRQSQLTGLQIWSEALGLFVKFGTALLVFLAVVAVISLVVSALRSSGLVIHAFSVPVDLTRRGLTGEAVAGQLLDRVRTMDEAVESVRAPSSYANDWDGRIVVEIPQTGISLDELGRHLRAALGSQIHVRGEIFHQPEAISLAVRVGDRAGQTLSVSGTDLTPLVVRGAEAIFHAAQPYRYGRYLRTKGRFNEARAVFRALANSGDASERPWGHNGLANLLLLTHGDRASYDQQVDARNAGIGNATLVANLGGTERRLGRSQDAADHFREAYRSYLLGDLAMVRRESRTDLARASRLRIQVATGDFLPASDMRPIGPIGSIEDDNYLIAAAQVAVHRPNHARAFLYRRPPPSTSSGDFRWLDRGSSAQIAALAAAEQEHWVDLLRIVDEFDRQVAGDPRGQEEARRLDHLQALALGWLGRSREAREVITPTPLYCYPCLIARGWIQARERDHARSDYWFARAVREGPRLPFADTEWGRALLARGDPIAAIRRFRRAIALQPRFADPHKYWGNALAAQGHYRIASLRYQAAADRAPRWAALHIDWGVSLWQIGRRQEALRKFAAAEQMDLSRRDRARLDRIHERIGHRQAGP